MENGVEEAGGNVELLSQQVGPSSYTNTNKDKVSQKTIHEHESCSTEKPFKKGRGKTKASESTENSNKTETPHYYGHRQRLRTRFLDDPKSLQNYELLELVLTYAIPRRDVKPLAKSLLKEFGDLWSLVRAPVARLQAFGLTEHVIVALQSMGELAERGLQEQIKGKPIITHWEQLLSYCKAAMGAEREEQFRLLFLDNKNRLMSDEIQHRGTINHTAAYPREVVRRALDLGAANIILVHNHPSGDPTPSAADIKLTKEIVAAAKPLGIRVHDHLIISRNEHASLKAMGLF